MNKQDKQEPYEQQPQVEDLTVNEDQSSEINGGAIAMPNFLTSRRSANG